MDHLDQAVYDTVHNSEMSSQGISRSLGMSHQVLLNKANPQNEFHKLSLRESIAIQLITGNSRIHEAMGDELDINAGQVSGNLMEAVLAAAKEHGDVVRAVHDALADGSLTHREAEQCQGEISEAIDSLVNLRKVVALKSGSKV